MQKIKSCFKNFLETIKNDFQKIQKGEEDLNKVIWLWGGLAYVASFFISKLVILVKLSFIKWIIAILVITYFIWHILAIRKCSPKNPELTEEEKAALKKDRVNRFFRKLFLREPITKWNSSTFSIVVDLYIIVVFFGYLF